MEHFPVMDREVVGRSVDEWCGTGLTVHIGPAFYMGQIQINLKMEDTVYISVFCYIRPYVYLQYVWHLQGLLGWSILGSWEMQWVFWGYLENSPGILQVGICHVGYQFLECEDSKTVGWDYSWAAFVSLQFTEDSLVYCGAVRGEAKKKCLEENKEGM